jgi:hypothetical protein
MNMLKILFPCLALAAGAFAAVDMNPTGCGTPGDQVVPNYENNTPDPWDMHKWGMSIDDAGGQRTYISGDFAKGSSGGFAVQPGGSPTVDYASCSSLIGTLKHPQLMSKLHGCNEPKPPLPPNSLQCADVSKIDFTGFYNAAKCVPDSLGVSRGDGYGGFIDSYGDNTQIQVALPSGSWQVISSGGTRTVKFDPKNSMGGPFYMMAAVAMQEYMQIDMQFLLAMGATASGAGLVLNGGGTAYQSPPNTGMGLQDFYGSFAVQFGTGDGRLRMDYPRYFADKNWRMNTLTGDGEGQVTPGNSPYQVNSAMMGTLALWWLYDVLKGGEALCFKQFLLETKDKTAGLKLMMGGYFIGPNPAQSDGKNDDFALHVIPTTSQAILGQADITASMKAIP